MQKAFSLIELIVSLLIISFSLISVNFLYKTNTTNNILSLQDELILGMKNILSTKKNANNFLLFDEENQHGKRFIQARANINIIENKNIISNTLFLNNTNLSNNPFSNTNKIKMIEISTQIPSDQIIDIKHNNNIILRSFIVDYETNSKDEGKEF